MNKILKARAIAFYLPQFHPIPENDEAWGKGFTEWTNVTKTKPLFKGHYQPQLPADLGFYDLRVPEVREAQADLAKAHGVEAFCYWHYWFDGDRLLERPFQEVLESGKPDFPFCLGWANHTWSGAWSGGDEKKIYKKQTYPGKEGQRKHFEYLLKAFRDPRYVKIEGKPLLLIFSPRELPESKNVLDYWRELADKAGLPGLYLIANLEYNDRKWNAQANGFDAVTIWSIWKVIQEARPMLLPARLEKQLTNNRFFSRIFPNLEKCFPALKRVYNYNEIREQLICQEKLQLPHHPMAIPNWDTTARYQKKAVIFHDSSPEAFRLHLRDVLKLVENDPAEKKIIFLKSWNEWAEGNYLEPDRRFGNGYLKILRDELTGSE